jgi:hypothetical protein
MATLRAARLAASNEGPPKLRVAIAAGAMPTAVAGMLSFFRPTPWNGVAIDELLFHLEQTRSAASAWRLKKTPREQGTRMSEENRTSYVNDYTADYRCKFMRN